MALGFGPVGFSPVGFQRPSATAPVAAVATVYTLWSDLSTVPPGAVTAFGLGPSRSATSPWSGATAPAAAGSAFGAVVPPARTSAW